MIRLLASILLTFLLAAGSVAAQTSEVPSQGWTTMEADGVQWLRTPDGRPFFSKGVNIVSGAMETEKSRQNQAYYWKNFYPSLDAWRKTVGSQLDGWGFNTRGGWSDPSPDMGLALTVDLELGRNAKFHWFDPFDPAMEATTLEWAKKLTAPYQNDPLLIGYYSDNEVGWWNSPLFTWYLKAGWENHTKRVLWQLLHDHYGGDWNLLLKDWVPQGGLGSFEELKRAGSQLKLRAGGEGIHLVDRFMALCAGHYYQLMSQAIRKAHPGALILGDRLPLYYHQDAVLAMRDNVDVISTNYNVDTPDGWIAPYYFEGLQRLTGKPVLVTEFFFAAEENRSGNRNETARKEHPKPGHLMTVDTQAERAWGAAAALVNFARFPNIVGVHWFQYADEPLGGREDGEDYNMGLVDTANRPYEEVTDLFQRLNPVLEAYHEEGHPRASLLNENIIPVKAQNPAIPSSSAGTPTILKPLHSIDVTDQSLVDWDKANTRLQGLQTPQPYVPFGDFHLCWKPEGLYLASIANTFVDPLFLDYKGEFPQAEAFQIHLQVEAEGGRLNHFVIYLIPEKNPALPDGFEINPQLYRQVENGPMERMPIQGHVQRLRKFLPHMAVEAFFPSDWLGIPALKDGMKLKMNITAASYYREMTMTWFGAPTLKSAEDPETLRIVVLRDSTAEQRAQND